MAPSKAVAARLFQLPSKYTFLKFLGEGAFAKVVKCLDEETGETVAIKLPKRWRKETRQEISILKKFKSLNLDKHNIVKFIDCFQTSYGKAFVFESLDISLYDYWKKRDCAPMLLSDIRTIIYQMATALKALREIKLIHTDVHLENIMMVNHKQRPFEVKLIDFGLAISKLDARPGLTVQPLIFRAPEVIMGRWFTEAIDMWTLGCAMFQMVSGCEPFSGESEYEIVLGIVELLCQLDSNYLSGCERACVFYKSVGSRKWRMKTPSEFYRKVPKRRARKSHQFKTLDDMKAIRLEENNLAEAEEREQCIELLKAMLTVAYWERITPRKVLAHPFITKYYPNDPTDVLETPITSEEDEDSSTADEDSSTIQPDGCTPSTEILPSGVMPVPPTTAKNTTLLEDQESEVSECPTAPLKDEDSCTIQPDGCTPFPEILPSGVILARPATAESTTSLEDQDIAVSEPPTAPLKDEDSSTIQPDGCTPSTEILPWGVIMARPATAKNTTSLEDQESAVSEPPTAPLKDEDSCTIQPDGFTASPEILPSGVSLVRPVIAENTTLLDDQESAVSEPLAAPLKDEDSSTIQPDGCTASPEILPSGVILVQPVTAKNTTSLEDQESAVSEPPTAPLKDEDSSTIQLDGCTPSTEILPSGVIMAGPATAKNTTSLEDQEIPVSFQSVLNKTSKSSVRDADENTKISEDSTTCDTGTKKKGKKTEKNSFRHVLPWLREKFSCRVSPID
ncbi:homeodomain-interacting protein kinase 1-like isoform X2 [Sparus aurata]|uniref:homeodomain-interacting protein kinase 1-like isoform X2 n=1 Tax=Sparus aurata TaxID=8175 RepID=UPI0011C19A3A|nr:homeodomain-interacting protein kinase 1-like isoform X2 [Sparus aurata]